MEFTAGQSAESKYQWGGQSCAGCLHHIHPVQGTGITSGDWAESLLEPEVGEDLCPAAMLACTRPGQSTVQHGWGRGSGAPTIAESRWLFMAQTRENGFSLGVWSLGGCPHSSGRPHPHSYLRNINQTRWVINRLFKNP